MTYAARSVAALLAAFLAGSVLAQDNASKGEAKAQAKKPQPVYTVAKYDPTRKAAEDLAATIKRAKAERKRIILEVGGTW